MFKAYSPRSSKRIHATLDRLVQETSALASNLIQDLELELEDEKIKPSNPNGGPNPYLEARVKTEP